MFTEHHDNATSTGTDERNKGAKNLADVIGGSNGPLSPNRPPSKEQWKMLLRELSIEDLTDGVSLRSTESKFTNLNVNSKKVRSPPNPDFYGSFGHVFRCSYYAQASGQQRIIAVKRITSKPGEDIEKAVINLKHELRIWSQVGSNHPNVLPLLGCAFLEEFGWEYPVMVSEWVGDISLRFSLQLYNRKAAVSLALGIAKGIRFLHSKGIIHSDIKSENVLIQVQPKMEPLLIDFGIASLSSSNDELNTIGRGTVQYKAPELFDIYSVSDESDELTLEQAAAKHTGASDTWAFGMTVYELLSREPPYTGNSEAQLEIWIPKGKILPKSPKCLENKSGPESELESSLWEICQSCWQKDPGSRPTMDSFIDILGLIYDGMTGEALLGISVSSPTELLSSVLGQTLRDMTNNIVLESKEHEGAKEVYKGRVVFNGFQASVKRIPIIVVNENTAKIFADEIRRWVKLRHLNIMPISGYCIQGKYPATVTNWVEKGSLRELIIDEKISSEESLQMLAGIARGLAYVHSQDLVHSNVKSSNVLIFTRKRVLLTDFGTTRTLAAFNTNFTNGAIRESTRWHAYELFHTTTDYTKETDVWAFGMTAYEILTRKLPYYHISEDGHVAIAISEEKRPNKPDFSGDPKEAVIDTFVWRLCQKCWELAPDKRPSMAIFEDEINKFMLAGRIQSEPRGDDFFDLPDLNQRPSSIELLARILERPHLDLTGKVFVEPLAVRMKHGGAADIFEGRIFETGEKVAVKRLRLNIGGDEKVAKNIAKEIRIWSELIHPNILPILGYCLEGDYPSLVTKWMAKGSLREYMPNLDKNPEETMSMILGIARGMAYIHSRKAVHSDLKTDNVLVSSDNQALLTGFGVSRMEALSAGFTTHPVKGSIRWQAREFFDSPNGESPAPTHTAMTDIWAFGMTVYELLTHELPYRHVRDNTQVMIFISHGELPKKPDFSHAPIDGKVGRYMWDICQRCWRADPESRPLMAVLESEIGDFIARMESEV